MTIDLIQTLLPAVFSAGGAYWAVKTELKYLRIDLEKLEHRVEKLENAS